MLVLQWVHAQSAGKNLKPRDVVSVLKHVTEQTGLTFKEETRSVPVLFVEPSK